MVEQSEQRNVILYDGVCNLCNGLVKTILDIDKKGQFFFASLQSDYAYQLLTNHKIEPNLKTLVLITNGKAYTKSNAAIKIAKILGGFWRAFCIFSVVPTSLRNRIYDLVASNRYRILGKTSKCRMMTPSLRKRFLDTI